MKSLTLALCVIAILGASASTFFYFQIGKTKEELQQQVAQSSASSNELQAKLTDAAAQSEALQKRLAALDSDLGEAKSKTTSAESRSTQLTRDVAQLRNQLTAKDDAEQALNREVSQLKRELAQIKLASASASASPEEIEGYKTTIATLQAKITQLESASGGVVAVASPTTGKSGGAVAGSLVGEVVSIGAQNAFVVLNIGSGKGVQAGQTFSINRNSNTVATATVSSVQESFSIAQIAVGSLRGGLTKGDTASLTH